MKKQFLCGALLAVATLSSSVYSFSSPKPKKPSWDLLEAIDYGKPENVEAALNAGADPDTIDTGYENKGVPALLVAIDRYATTALESCHKEFIAWPKDPSEEFRNIEILIRHNADVNKKSTVGAQLAPLQRLYWWVEHARFTGLQNPEEHLLPVLELIASKGTLNCKVDVEQYAPDGRSFSLVSPLEAALENDLLGFARILKKAGAKVTRKYRDMVFHKQTTPAYNSFNPFN